MSDSRLRQGIAAAKAGDRGTARRLLLSVIDEDPYSESAWLWLATVVDDPRRQRQCLQTVLQLNPDNELAQKGLARIQKTGALSAPQAVVRDTPELGVPLAKTVAAEKPGPTLQPVPVYNARKSLIVTAVITIVLSVCYLSLANFAEGVNDLMSSIATAGESGSESATRVIPPTYTPRGNRNQSGGDAGSSASSSGEYGEIAISRPRLAEYVERSSLSMEFYRDLDYTDGTYHHTLCTTGCRHKLVMRSETYDRDDLDNLDFSFIYSSEDDLTQGSLMLLSVVGLAIPDWNGLDQWYLDSAETYLTTGRETFNTRQNGFSVQLDFFYDAVDLEDAVLITVEE